jgi:hypothetical protein
MNVDSSRARAAGLRLSDPRETLRAAQAACAGPRGPLALAPEREAALIERLGLPTHHDDVRPWTTSTAN